MKPEKCCDLRGMLGTKGRGDTKGREEDAGLGLGRLGRKGRGAGENSVVANGAVKPVKIGSN